MGRTPRVVSARVRVLGAILAVAFVGLIVAGSVTFWVQRDRVYHNADEQLRGFAATIADLTSSAPASVRDAVTGTVAGRADGAIAIADGVVIATTPTSSGLDLASDEALLRVLEDSRPQQVQLASAVTDLGLLRYVAVPVGDTVIVQAISLDSRLELVRLGVATYALSGVVLLVAVAVVGWFVTGRLLSPLRALRDSADAITIDDFGRRLPADGNDEIADLSRTVNSMLDRIEGSVDVQRQLLDDVRHELKTPITIVRGHLEMMDAHNRDDVENTREIGIAELDRMTRLVDDIDQLATVEGGTLEMGIVDLDALTTRVGELVAVIPGHEWTVEARARGRVEGDYDRLLQAWLALADNAAKYTPADTPVEIGSALDEEGARLWVRDHGPGIPPAARHRIFRRFDRAAGRRTVGGSGLGLAIVDAIAKAHDGHCAVTDTVDGGATFTIHIPAGLGRPPADLPAPVRAGDVVMQREASG
jgi:two-component system, OmpR family, sensor kinase